MSKYPNSGSISKNERKEQPNHPDYKGKAEVDGVEYWISGWIKEYEGRKFLSLSFKRKDEAPPVKASRPLVDDGSIEAMADDIPF